MGEIWGYIETLYFFLSFPVNIKLFLNNKVYFFNVLFYLLAFYLLSKTSHTDNLIRKRERIGEKEQTRLSPGKGSGRNQSKARNGCKIQETFLSSVSKYSENRLTCQRFDLLLCAIINRLLSVNPHSWDSDQLIIYKIYHKGPPITKKHYAKSNI